MENVPDPRERRHPRRTVTGRARRQESGQRCGEGSLSTLQLLGTRANHAAGATHPRAVTGGRGPPGSGRTSGRVEPPRRAGKPRPRAHLDAALARQLHGRVVVATAQQVLHHHAVHALPLPHAGRRWLVAAVLLEVLDPALAKPGALTLRLDGLHRL